MSPRIAAIIRDPTKDGFLHESAGSGVARGIAGPPGSRDQAAGDDAKMPHDEGQVRPGVCIDYFLAHRPGEEDRAQRGSCRQSHSAGDLFLPDSHIY